MAARVDGCKITLPEALRMQRIKVDTLNLPELGFLENIVMVDERTLTFSFVPTTERGELMAKRMREGGCWIEAVVPREKQYGVTLRNLRFRVVFEDDSEDVRIVGGESGL